MDRHLFAMARAVALASTHHPHPNPRVGAVVLDSSGAVVGGGAHRAVGGQHAEVVALAEAGEAARGGTLVVTLEPCVHQGRTPPCVEAVIDAGIARVIVGVLDPDPRVDGKGVEHLRARGIAVTVGTGADLVEALDPGYLHHRRSARPRVTLKMAATLDGQAAAADGTSQWLTGPEARRDAHELRARSDAVMVGAGTVLADDPRLTVRLGAGSPDPRPVIIAGDRDLPADARLFARHPLVYSPRPLDLPAEVVVLPGATGVDLVAVMEDLGRRGIVDLLVEGGPTLAGALNGAGLVDRYVLYYGAGLAGGVGRPVLEGRFTTVAGLDGVDVVSVRLLEGDLRVEAVPAGRVAGRPAPVRTAEARLPIDQAEFRVIGYRQDGQEHVALVLGGFDRKGPAPLVRVHSECLTGDVFGSRRCDCRDQLHRALQRIAAEGSGALVYLRGHEGRGIGLSAKLQAYALQDLGRDTVEANLELGLPADAREYGIAGAILHDLGLGRIRLLSNNPAKALGLGAAGVVVEEMVALETAVTSDNRGYLKTKATRMGHLLEVEP